MIFFSIMINRKRTYLLYKTQSKIEVWLMLIDIHGETIYAITSQSKLIGVLENRVNNELGQESR